MIVKAIKRVGGFAQDSNLMSLRAVMRPLAGILVTTLGICLALLAALVVQTDQRGALQVQLMMRGALDTRLSALAQMTRDYGRWDDAVLNLYGNLDMKWATDNLSNATHVMVIDRGGRTLFSVGPDGSAGVDASKAMPEGTPDLLRRLPDSIEGARALESAVGLTTRFEGKPTLVAAMPILPYSDRIAAPKEPPRYVIITQALDQDLLNEWQASFRLRRVTLVDRLGVRQPAASAALKDSEGKVLAFIAWAPVRPGLDAARSILPYLMVGLLLLGISCLFLSTRVVAIVRALSKEHDAASRSSEIAAANLEIARQAQVRAEAARLRAEGLALQAESARREAELQEASSASSNLARNAPQAA